MDTANSWLILLTHTVQKEQSHHIARKVKYAFSAMDMELLSNIQDRRAQLGIPRAAWEV